jgi:hypothetical protein
MKIEFMTRENGPERCAAEAEIHFEEPGLEGLKLVGFTVWLSPEGEHFVTFPSRAFGAGGERRYFDYLRSVDGSPAPGKALKTAVHNAFMVWKEGCR